jgi:hypothetical protein
MVPPQSPDFTLRRPLVFFSTDFISQITFEFDPHLTNEITGNNGGGVNQ